MIGYRDAREVVICDGCQRVHRVKPGTEEEKQLRIGLQHINQQYFAKERRPIEHHACGAECQHRVRLTKHAQNIDPTAPVKLATFKQ